MTTSFYVLRTSSNQFTDIADVQVKEEFLEQAWSLLMDDPCDVEMQNGAQEATEAEEKGEDWGEDWEKWAKKRTVKLTLWSRNLAADLGLLGVSAQIDDGAM